ncbi:tetratricopeptide repeat protein [Thalassotalea marina]|uniref:Tetratricopeptide repeat protein n=1 Tax=Thalassotalea marina TaxID=1673741 RepID=A0A919EMF4_9GAMM|nr:tetratricopeptide repeat protein [Thalassotalea marina]GHF98242.1 hypothetical protein GCM10017161_28350 [Thalassotalea marina]
MHKLAKSLMLLATVTLVQLPVSMQTVAAEQSAEKPKRKVQLVGQSVGKKIAKAFELYSADDLDGALALLLEIEAKKDYDKAYTERFIANMYAMKGDTDEAIKRLKLAIEPDILNEADHGEALKLLAQLEMQTEDYSNAIKNFYAWMDFTGKEDGDTWTRIANAHYQLKQLDKMIVPADKAIAAYGDKHNKNPYLLKLTSYYERKDYKNSAKVLETALQLFPEEKAFWIQLGNMYLLLEDYDRGMATLDLAYKQGFFEKEQHFKMLAQLYAQRNIPYKAAVLLEKHIESGEIKRDDQSLFALANAWHAAQHIDKAANVYNELAKLTNEYKHYAKVGKLLSQDEQYKKAVIALEKALELGASDKGSIYMEIAISHFYLNEFKEAHKAIQEAMKDPKTRKSARGWVSHIKDTAKRKGKPI